mmetsp:Transcript_5684/g.14417  ORF Transcript_5684/g.14417 Transcript_5684/m.14417 type:complete len:242 (+) Transcript_5684:285-1010(+)
MASHAAYRLSPMDAVGSWREVAPRRHLRLHVLVALQHLLHARVQVRADDGRIDSAVPCRRWLNPGSLPGSLPHRCGYARGCSGAPIVPGVDVTRQARGDRNVYLHRHDRCPRYVCVHLHQLVGVVVGVLDDTPVVVVDPREVVLREVLVTEDGQAAHSDHNKNSQPVHQDIRELVEEPINIQGRVEKLPAVGADCVVHHYKEEPHEHRPAVDQPVDPAPRARVHPHHDIDDEHNAREHGGA